ncbi:MAG: helix-turn-helix transcriptional regulator [Chitinivibrionales bacterium]|nr:helix-turn-helix transcriptional regulator [Chitinivibrionales bacterium]
MAQKVTFFSYFTLKRIPLFIPIAFFIPLVLIFPPNSHITVFPQKNDTLSVMTSYCDESDGGKSEIREISSPDSGLAFTFTLRQGYAYPYAGISIQFMANDSFIDVSPFNYVAITAYSDKAESFNLYLKTFIDGFTIPTDMFTQYFLMKEVPLQKEFHTHRVYFKDFIVPSWWIAQNKLLESKIGKPQFEKTISMHIENGTVTPLDQTFTIHIKKITFGKDNNIAYLLFVCIVIFYYLLYFLVKKLLKKRAPKQVIIPYKELEVKNDADNEMKRLTECIARNFSDPNLAVEKLAREAGISAAKIPVLLKREYNMNFKQYLNKIRITEAQRLLKESDNQIVSCAYAVGYNNIPHFNRTFKQSVGLSPKEYRKQFKAGKAEEEAEESN